MRSEHEVEELRRRLIGYQAKLDAMRDDLAPGQEEEAEEALREDREWAEAWLEALEWMQGDGSDPLSANDQTDN